jgi:hypothetical protein
MSQCGRGRKKEKEEWEGKNQQPVHMDPGKH